MSRVIVIGGQRLGKSAAVAEALRELEEAGAEVLVVEPLDLPGADLARQMDELRDRVMADLVAVYGPAPRTRKERRAAGFLVRDRSTPEKDDWWRRVCEAAVDAPTLLYERPEEEED